MGSIRHAPRVPVNLDEEGAKLMPEHRLLAVQPRVENQPALTTAMLGDQFATRIAKLGVVVEHATSTDRIAARVADLAAAVAPEARRVVLAPALAERYPALRRQLEARGVVLAAINTADPAITFGESAIGISRALLGIAETGTYVVADTLPDRLVRMLAFSHLVVLDGTHIVPGLDEAGEWLRARFAGADGAPSTHYVSFITGPSRTADIEMSLTVGAHGPAALRIVILDASGE